MMANAQLFSLSWSSHTNAMSEGFCSLQQNGEFVDMTLAADGHLVKVHQAVIALASPYLKELITSAPCPHPVIFLTNVSMPTLSILLEYIYTGEATIPSVDFPKFMDVAKALQIKGLNNIQDSSPTHKQEDRQRIQTPGTKRKADEILEQTSKLPINAKNISLKQDSENDAKRQAIFNPENSLEIEWRENEDQTDHVHDSNDDDGYHESTNAKDVLKTSNLQYTTSIHGALQVILNRYIYNLSSTSNSGTKRWRCIDYRNRSLNCKAFVVTKDNVVVNRGNPHCHAFHDKKILKKVEKNSIYTATHDFEPNQIKNKNTEDEIAEYLDDE